MNNHTHNINDSHTNRIMLIDHAWLTASTQPSPKCVHACMHAYVLMHAHTLHAPARQRLSAFFFAGHDPTVHPLDVLSGLLVDVAFGVPIMAVVIIVIARPHPRPRVVPLRLRPRRRCRRRLVLPPAGALVVAPKQGRKEGPPPHRHRTTHYTRLLLSICN